MSKKQRKISAKSDIFFRYLFSAPENEDLLVDFINAVFRNAHGKTIKSAKVLNPFNLREAFFAKESILDVKAITDRETLINIELQAVGNFFYSKRILYYLAKLHTSQLKNADSYSKLMQTIGIHLIDFELEKNSENVHNCYHLYSEMNKNLCFSEDLEIHILELPKLKNNINADKKLLAWLEYFAKAEEGKNMEAVINKNPKLSRADELFKYFTENKELMEYEDQLKAKRDLEYWKSCVREQFINELRDQVYNEVHKQIYDEMHKQVYNEVHKQIYDEMHKQVYNEVHKQIYDELSKKLHNENIVSEKLGEHKKAIETAKVLKAANVSLNLIADSTGLLPEEIEKL